jgi:hypothetical protein
MAEHAEVGTLMIRIPIRLQRRGGRKLIMTPEGVSAPAPKPRRDAGQGARARAPVAAQNRERPREVHHRLGGARGRYGRLRLPASAAHLPCAGHRRGDAGRAAAEGAEVG